MKYQNLNLIKDIKSLHYYPFSDKKIILLFFFTEYIYLYIV